MTLPLYRGQMTDGTPVWYVLTDTTDKANADALGLNFAGKLTYADVPGATRVATLSNDLSLTFESGAVDFSPEYVLLPGPAEAPFPPEVAEPGRFGRWLTEVFNDWPEGSRAAALAAEIADPPVWHTRDDHP